MRLLHTKDLQLHEFGDREVPPYAILSHRWENEEVTLQDIKTPEAVKLKGYKKVSKACSVAAAHGFDYIWIDTCCIDKTSSAELSEAINSMYRWYQEAEECYAYLSDVSHHSVDPLNGVTGPEFQKSKWFTRGWTLQELIAPSSVVFFDDEWQEIGDKSNLQGEISKITGIPGDVLLGDDLRHASVAQRMSWASKRETTRTEDLAYCLMGLFDIYMPMLYGEGERAFIRLQEEIMKVSDDHSLFAWRSTDIHGGILASSPAAFINSGNIISVSPAYATSSPLALSSRGIHLSLLFRQNGQQGKGLAILHCTEKGKEEMRFAIHLKDVFLKNEDFIREQSTTLELFHMENIDPSQYPLTSLYVRQWYPTRNRNWEGMGKCVVELASVNAHEAASRVTNLDSNCELSDGMIVMDMNAVSDGLLSRLVIMCKDRNLFQISLSKHGRSLSADICTEITDSQNIQDVNILKNEPNDQDRIVKALSNGQHVHVTIKKRVRLLQGKRCLCGVVEVSYSSTLKGVWFEHVAILENQIENTRLLFYAAKCGLTLVLEHLQERESIEPESKDDGRTPLSWAAEGGQWDIVKYLLEKGASLESSDKNGRTALSWAAQGGQEDIVERLIDIGATFENLDKNSRTPLSWAAGSGREAVVKLLLAKVAALDATENNITDPKKLRGRKPLKAFHIFTDKVTNVQAKRTSGLARRHPLMSEDETGQTPLYYAAKNGHEAVVQLLIENGAQVNATDKQGSMPLYWAACNGHSEVVQLLLKKGANVNVNEGDEYVPLYWASHNGHIDIVQILVGEGANVDKAELGRFTPLYIASKKGHVKVVQLLLKNRANLNGAGIAGWAPLYWAAYSGHFEVVRILLEKGANINIVNEQGWTLLQEASHRGHVEVAKLLLEKVASANAAMEGRSTPLYIASYDGHVEAVKLLLEKGADANWAAKGDGCSTPLYAASKNGHVIIVQLLLEKGADAIRSAKQDGSAPLYIACSMGHVEVAKLLLEKGASVNAAIKGRSTPLYTACSMGHVEVAKLLLEKGASVRERGQEGLKPLHWASKEGHAEVVKLLLEKKASVSDCDGYGLTPLHWASRKGHLQVVKLLLKKGANISGADSHGSRPLCWASQEGHVEVVKLLLQKGAIVSDADQYKLTPLYWASKEGHVEVVKLLLEKGASVSVADKHGSTPLYWACKDGNVEIVKLLLDNDAKWNRSKEAVSTPLEIATQYGHVEIVRLLVESGAGADDAEEVPYKRLEMRLGEPFALNWGQFL